MISQYISKIENRVGYLISVLGLLIIDNLTIHPQLPLKVMLKVLNYHSMNVYYIIGTQ